MSYFRNEGDEQPFVVDETADPDLRAAIEAGMDDIINAAAEHASG